MLHPNEQHILQRRIEIEPHLLGCDTMRIVRDKAWKKVRNLCTTDIGFVMRIDKINNIQAREIDIDTGNLIYMVDFTVTSFRPKIGDTIIAQVIEVGSDGVFAKLGPMKVYIPVCNIPTYYDFIFNESGETASFVSTNDEPEIKVGSIQKIEMCEVKKLNIEDMDDTEYKYIGGKLMGIGKINYVENDDQDDDQEDDVEKDDEPDFEEDEDEMDISDENTEDE